MMSLKPLRTWDVLLLHGSVYWVISSRPLRVTVTFFEASSVSLMRQLTLSKARWNVFVRGSVTVFRLSVLS